MNGEPDTSPLTIPSRFRGPSASGNGGYTAGALAGRVVLLPTAPAGSGAGARQPAAPGAVEVTLRQPPPLDVAMRVEREPDGVSLVLGGSRIAEATWAGTEIGPVEPVAPAEARAAMAAYPGLTSHPFPSCFVCGPDRSAGDGLRIFPGPVSDRRMASLWTPPADLAEHRDADDPECRRLGLALTWAALDCIGGWAGDMAERRMVLGRMTGQVDALPVAGEQHVVVGEARGQEGRKTFTASTLYDADGRIVGRASHVWIAVDPGAFAAPPPRPRR